jgi:hypothetical protein
VETTRKFAGRGDDRELDKDCGRNCATHRKLHPDVLLDLLAMSATFEKPLDTSVGGNEATKDKDKKDGTVLSHDCFTVIDLMKAVELRGPAEFYPNRGIFKHTPLSLETNLNDNLIISSYDRNCENTSNAYLAKPIA